MTDEDMEKTRIEALAKDAKAQGSGRGARTRALVVGPYLNEKSQRPAARPQSGLDARRSAQARIDEATGLAGAIDLEIVGAKIAASG